MFYTCDFSLNQSDYNKFHRLLSSFLFPIKVTLCGFGMPNLINSYESLQRLKYLVPFITLSLYEKIRDVPNKAGPITGEGFPVGDDSRWRGPLRDYKIVTVML